MYCRSRTLFLAELVREGARFCRFFSLFPPRVEGGLAPKEVADMEITGRGGGGGREGEANAVGETSMIQYHTLSPIGWFKQISAPSPPHKKMCSVAQ